MIERNPQEMQFKKECPSEEELWQLFDSRLSEERKHFLRKHLQECSSCNLKWKGLERLDQALKDFFSDISPEERIVEKSISFLRRRRIRKVSLIAACAAGFIVCLYLGFSSGLLRSGGSSDWERKPLIALEREGKQKGAFFPEQRIGLKERKVGMALSEGKGSEPGESLQPKKKVHSKVPSTRVSLACGAFFEKEEDSVADIWEDTAKTCTIFLGGGRIRCCVERPVQYFKVQTPLITVAVHGTVFTVLHDPVLIFSEVRVQRGKVSVFDRKGKLIKVLKAGEFFSTTKRKEESPPVSPREYEIPAPEGAPPADLPERRGK